MSLPFSKSNNDAVRMPLPASGDSGTGLLLLVLALALGFRLFLALATDFPINDGALFYEFVKGVAATFPNLPETVRYNAIDVPFAYPPLSFWLGAVLVRIGADPLDVVHYLPIAMNAAYVLLFTLVLLKSGHGRLFAAIALFFFAARLRSFEWLVMGGGLSRGLGALFFMLVLLAVTIPGPRGDEREPLPPWRSALAGMLVGGAIVSHLEWGVLAAATFALSRALAARGLKEFVASSALGGAACLLVVAPWLLFVQVIHGLEPFLAAGGSGGWGIASSAIKLAKLLVGSLTNPFVLVGGYVLLRRRDFFWPAFILLCLLVTPRHGWTPVALALAVLSAHGVMAAWQILRGMIPSRRVAAAATAVAVIAIVAIHESPEYRRVWDWFRPLPAEERQAMAWIRQEHPRADFAVLTNAHWSYDASAEWLPTLTGVRSLTTVQGREWLPNRVFRRYDEMNERVLRTKSCPDLLRKLRFYGRPDFLWAEAMRRCFRPPAYLPVYKNSSVTIFRLAGGRGQSASSASAEASSIPTAGGASATASSTEE